MPEKPVWYRALVGSVAALLGANSLALASRINDIDTARKENPNVEVTMSGQDLMVQSVGFTAAQNCLVIIVPLNEQACSTTTTKQELAPTTTIKPPLPTPQPAEPEVNTGLAAATPAEHSYLGCISQHESTDNPREYNRAGPYYGKYQFLQTTWDNFVTSINHEELAGVDIRNVPEPVQDYIAWRFLQAGRKGEWGPNKLCVHYLR